LEIEVKQEVKIKAIKLVIRLPIFILALSSSYRKVTELFRRNVTFTALRTTG
jgi:hypothetical protein